MFDELHRYCNSKRVTYRADSESGRINLKVWIPDPEFGEIGISASFSPKVSWTTVYSFLNKYLGDR